jgi:molybdopterin-containing oxidoreductase family membrane subunit
MEKMTGKRFVTWEIKQLMGKIAGTMLLVYIVFKLLDTGAWAMNLLPREGLTFVQLFHGWIYGKWLLFAELIVCGVVPCIILLLPKLRMNPALFYLAAILDCTGIVINRYVQTVQSLAFPVMRFDVWQTYAPNWVEWAASILVLAYGALLLSLSYRYLPIFPQESDLNGGKAAAHH